MIICPNLVSFKISKVMSVKYKAIILGGSGFLGDHLSKLLIKKKFDVSILDIRINKSKSKSVKFIKGDIKNFYNLKKILKNFDYIFNFAGISDLEDANKNPIKTITNNINGTVNILECIKNSKKLKRLIFASSIYAISKQGGFYSTTKRSCENLIEDYSKKYGIKFSILRYGSIYGVGSGTKNAIYNLIYQGIKNKKILREGTGNEVRNYINVVDASNLTYQILKKKYENTYLNIIGKNKIKVKLVIKKIAKKLNIKKVIFLKNIKSQYHYSKNPYDYELPRGKTIKPKNNIKIDRGIDLIIDEIKK